MPDPNRDYEDALKALAAWVHFLEQERQEVMHQLERLRRSAAAQTNTDNTPQGQGETQ
ncbi:hypothetical protein QYE77_14890 (plasmid) [Thermanaerothrix sp. 4228-RoL]|jgi:predicted Fe-S protein YdhL (DUF1289 family)|uniref:Uncharacterized protein n=1 Tax=Thermanaerothrix solaris TaxID=3058434 RepID=A0ABU3NRU9_9CHLR|nr:MULTISPECIES: hypothetical protein [unclassified Thermanaerothrix]MDT8899549.1 hypothetical protein [Thermanaerothrix sp. 4228-RoL]